MFVPSFDPDASFINQKMAATLAKFASIPVKYAPKRKFLEFAAPQWKNKLGEFSDPDVLGWINRLYQDKAFPTREAFNKAYDEGRAMGLSPGAAVAWRNKTMVLTKTDVDNLEEEFNGGGFDDGQQAAVRKMLMKMRAALETGEKVLFVY
jgi:hypothetical protein